jgi:hypothetical protein
VVAIATEPPSFLAAEAITNVAGTAPPPEGAAPSVYAGGVGSTEAAAVAAPDDALMMRRMATIESDNARLESLLSRSVRAQDQHSNAMGVIEDVVQSMNFRLERVETIVSEQLRAQSTYQNMHLTLCTEALVLQIELDWPEYHHTLRTACSLSGSEFEGLEEQVH